MCVRFKNVFFLTLRQVVVFRMLKFVSAPLLRGLAVTLRVHPARTYLPRFQAPSCFVIQRLGFNSTCVALARKKSEEPAGEGGEEGEWPQEPIQSTTKRRTSVKVIRSVNTARSDSLASESSTRKKKASTSASGGAAASSGSAAPPARHEDLIPSDSFIVTIQRRPLMPGTGVPMTLSDTSLFSALEKMKAQNDPRHKYMTLVWVPGLEDGELNSDPTKLPPNPIGTLCLIVKSNYANASNQSYLLHGLKRVRIGQRARSERRSQSWWMPLTTSTTPG
jgi:hypothetical protein